MEKTLKILASVFWIVGLTATIVGLNIKTDTGKWVSTIGNITFLVGPVSVSNDEVDYVPPLRTFKAE